VGIKSVDKLGKEHLVEKQKIDQTLEEEFEQLANASFG
jgi:hypothetical protein